MTAGVLRADLLDEAAAEYLASTGRLYLVVGLIRCVHDGLFFLPVEDDGGDAAYECATGHRVGAEAVETEVEHWYMNQFAASRQRVSAPENVRRLLLDAGISVLVDVYGKPRIQRLTVGSPLI